MNALEELLKISRRGLLGGAALLLVPLRAAKADPLPALEAAAARILPSGDGPGAREAQVGRFIERQLSGELSELRPAFEQLGKLLDLWSQKSFGAPFAQTSAEQQDRMLEQLSRGEIPARGLPQETLFRALHTLVLEGFLSDPKHGGNDARVGWKAIGFGLPHGHHH